MASKALKVVGIGCGVIMLLGVIGVGGAAYWAKGKFEGMAEWSQQMDAQNKELASLNSTYEFQEPAEGEPLKLSDERLQHYFAIRSELEPVLAKYESEMKKFEKKDGQEPSVSEAMGAIGATGKLMAEMRGTYIAQLKAHQMSPREFSATTATVLTGGLGGGEPEGEHAELFKANAKLLEGYKAQLENQKTVALDALIATNDSM